MVRKIVRRHTRRFYDYEKHNYVSLNEIAQYIKNNETIEIVDENGIGVANGTLLQILIKKANAIDTNRLAELVNSVY